ncbi:MAG: 30S ribosomal protein S8e [Candidatus Bathyarchaeia archaeon]
MTQWHWSLDKRKKSGGKRRPFRGKRAYERGCPPSETRLGDKRLKAKRVRGGNLKLALLACREANVVDPSSGKAQKAEIRDVLENPANREFQKREIITKGAVIATSMGKAKVTSRPGQDGVINAVLIEPS